MHLPSIRNKTAVEQYCGGSGWPFGSVVSPSSGLKSLQQPRGEMGSNMIPTSQLLTDSVTNVLKVIKENNPDSIYLKKKKKA